MSQTDDLPALLETPFGLFHECTCDDDSEGWQEFLDCPGYTTDHMRAYATAARAPLLARIAELEAALGELVELKRMKDSLGGAISGAAYESYRTRKPLAWEAAHAAMQPMAPGRDLQG